MRGRLSEGVKIRAVLDLEALKMPYLAKSTLYSIFEHVNDTPSNRK